MFGFPVLFCVGCTIFNPQNMPWVAKFRTDVIFANTGSPPKRTPRWNRPLEKIMNMHENVYRKRRSAHVHDFIRCLFQRGAVDLGIDSQETFSVSNLICRKLYEFTLIDTNGN